MSGWGNETMPRGAADLRSQKGHRVLFDKEQHAEAWACARIMKRLTPWEQRAVRLLAEGFLAGHLEDAAAEKGGA